jgi:hypothetical protein
MFRAAVILSGGAPRKEDQSREAALSKEQVKEVERLAKLEDNNLAREVDKRLKTLTDYSNTNYNNVRVSLREVDKRLKTLADYSKLLKNSTQKSLNNIIDALKHCEDNLTKKFGQVEKKFDRLERRVNDLERRVGMDGMRILADVSGAAARK